MFGAGTWVQLDGTCAALRPCRYCGSLEGTITDPKGPHGEGVRCANCDRHIGWLPKQHDDHGESIIDDHDIS